MRLQIYLKRAGRVTGPLGKNTSHSALEVIKKYLLGLPQFKGGESFLFFGNHLHSTFAKEDPSGYAKHLSDSDLVKLVRMQEALDTHPVVKRLKKGATQEVKRYVKLNGVVVAIILDVHQIVAKTGADLKTSDCKTVPAFIKKARKIGYFRQAKTYMLGAGLRYFFFITITKEEDPTILVIDVGQYKDDLNYAEHELDFLLYFFANYGNVLEGVATPITEAANTKQLTTMKQTGKEAMASIQEQAKVVKEATKASRAADSALVKEQAKLTKMIAKFPANERALYEEKLSKFA